MPGRKFPLVNQHFYHIYNRGVELRPIYKTKIDYERFLELMKYYRFHNTNLCFSKFKELSKDKRHEYYNELETENRKNAEIICYCLMPNHFHILIQQIQTNGITNYLRKFQNAYTKYFNKKYQRTGPLFQGTFKSVLIESEEQLFHVFRYILLNPYSSAIVDNLKNLINYPWSSIGEYLLGKTGMCFKETIHQKFKIKRTLKEFIFNQADYQRRLENIKHLVLEDRIFEGCVPAQP
jgi:putative transposase